jgi:hypothetical protein
MVWLTIMVSEMRACKGHGGLQVKLAKGIRSKVFSTRPSISLKVIDGQEKILTLKI